MARVIPLVVALAIPLALGLWWLLCRSATTTRGGRFMRGLGWAALCALPAVVVQFARGGQGNWQPEAILYAPIAWWVLLGGASVQFVFESTVSTLFGSRQSTMSHGEWYLVLAAVQTAAIACVVAARLRKGARCTDPVVVLLGALVLANALLGAEWPWWGT